MSIVRSMVWLVPMQLGAYAGYLTFGFFANRVGRRRLFVAFLVGTAALVPIYGQLARSPELLMVLGPVLGFVGHGYFPMFGALLAEIFPTAVRSSGQGLTYNVGRGIGALAPFVIGFGATLPEVGIGGALALTSAFFVAAALLVFTLPDTSREPLVP
jgi:MFS family permease